MADGNSECKVKAGRLFQAFLSPLSSLSTDERSRRMTVSILSFIIIWVCCSRSDENREYNFTINLTLAILPDELLVYSAPNR